MMMRVTRIGSYKPQSINGADRGIIVELAKHLPTEDSEVELWRLTPESPTLRGTLKGMGWRLAGAYREAVK